MTLKLRAEGFGLSSRLYLRVEDSARDSKAFFRNLLRSTRLLNETPGHVGRC
jgi:hypothetical protein